MRKSGLGRGLDVLLPQSEEFLETVVRDLPISDIDPNTSQPRKEFDKEAITNLAESIKSAGVLQPILVAENGSRYHIIAGERRYRAARLAGLTSIPCIVRSMTEQQRLEAALIENLQREDLNPMDEAAAVKSLIQQCGYTQEEAAQRLGKSRPAIANLLRLMTLPPEIADMVRQNKLSAGHARALAGASPQTKQIELAHQTVLYDYSVRKLEELIKKQQQSKTPAAPKPLSPELNTLQDAMRETFGVKTTLTGNEKRGKILLTYNSPDELEHLFEVIGRIFAK